MKIVGIDPGLAVTGFGVINSDGEQFQCGDSGILRTRAHTIPDRLKEIFLGITDLLEREKPSEVAIEEGFYGKNVKVALSLGQARGAILLACRLKDIPIFEYSPREVKLATAGTGSASKEQVGFMITALLNLPQPPKILDISDALAVAYCHCCRRESVV